MFSRKIGIFILFLFCFNNIPKQLMAEKTDYVINEVLLNADTTKSKRDSVQSSSPRDGKYLILSYGSNPATPMRLGFFTLSGTNYKYNDLEGKLLGEGTYVYDVSEKQIKWQTGPFKAIGWSGDFNIEGNGKTHTIRLKNNTVGTSSNE